MKFGLLVGNRGFFPAHLVKSGREEMIARLQSLGHEVICPTPEQTKFGAVESRADAKACAALFSEHRGGIDGVIVTLPNFGDEKTVAETLRLAGLDVPVLVHAFPDTPGKMTIADRRDSFCGKMSVCNNLQQFKIRYTLTTLHTVDPSSAGFAEDVSRFAAVCRVANGLRKLRIGSVGARPSAFNTVRYSEKILEANGITVEPIDLSEIFGRIDRLGNSDAPVHSQARRDPRVCFDGQRPAASRWSKWPSWARCWTNGCKLTSWPSAPCNAGPRWKNTSAWFPAR